MKVNSTYFVLAALLFLLCKPVSSYINCASNSTGIGCLLCDNSTSQSYAFNKSQMKYTCIESLNCNSVAGNACIACISPFYLDRFTNQCVSIQGCISVYNGSCQACESVNYVLLQGSCYKKQINFCTQYALTNSTLQCAKCLYLEMDPALNCSYNASICQQFDYQVFKCKKCSAGKYLHSDGKSCYSPILNCEVYESSITPKCLLCKSNYIFDPTTNTCLLGQPKGISSQILVYNIANTFPTYSYTCLNNLFAMNETSFACDIAAPLHCSAFNSTNSSLCLQCLPGYYLRSNDSKCIECSVFISNCALCSDSSVCSVCAQTYFLVNSTTKSVCMPCSSFGCLDCSTDFDASGKVRCLSCNANKTLYAGSCIPCSSSYLAYYVAESQCRACNLNMTECLYCRFTGQNDTSSICLQCSYGYFYNSSQQCIQIQTTTSVTFETAAQILRKVSPGSNYNLYPDSKYLVSYCNSTDGFTCICTSTNLTSICSSFTLIPNISALIFNTYEKIASYPDQLRMAAELPNFSLQTHFPVSSTYEPLSLYQFWNVLAAYTFTIVRSQQNGISNQTSPTVVRIFNQAKAMLNVFSDQKITILRGNGFYFKYIPSQLASGGTGDDSYIKTSLSSQNYVIIYTYYSRLVSQSSGSLTGKIYVYTENTQADFLVYVQKSRYADSSSYSVKIQGISKANNVTFSNGFLQIKNFPKSTATSVQGLQVFGVAAATTDDIYASQRIQNIFYSESWLYILFFIALYLIFIPLCAMVDCCEAQQSMRKKVNTQQPSENKDQNSNNRQSQQENVVKVNYRDFFPLYNVGNTPRTWRLDKLCLFIVNMQHIITYLTLIYFNLRGSMPVAAIALVIPAYLCTVIMGYICGAIFRFLPGHFKLFINLISLGYWILWIFLMKIMSTSESKQYRLFILVFSILSFFLDLTIDALQTLLVYFSIRQGEKQVSLFRCLAKWLSFRGFYQFDKLAKQLEASEQ